MFAGGDAVTTSTPRYGMEIGAHHSARSATEILHRQEAACLPHRRINRLAQRAAIERRGAFGLDRAQRRRQVALHEPLARRKRPAVAAVDGPRRGGERLERAGNRARASLGEDESVRREVHGRREDVGPRQPAVGLRERFPGVQVARRGNRLRAAPVLEVVRSRRAVGIRIDSDGNAPARIQEARRPGAGVVDHDCAVAADSRVLRLDDVQRGGHGHRGVERIAPGIQDGDTRLRRERVGTADHAAQTDGGTGRRFRRAGRRLACRLADDGGDGADCDDEDRALREADDWAAAHHV